MSEPSRRSARSPAGPVRFAIALTVLVLPAALAGGCGPAEKALVLSDKAEFDAQALNADKPALVMFFKGGCASCAILEPGFDRLATEYKDRAVVAKMMILTLVFGITEPELYERYGVVFVPHVVLLVNGQEKKHWIADYNLDHYRQALDEVVPPPTTQPANAAAGQVTANRN